VKIVHFLVAGELLFAFFARDPIALGLFKVLMELRDLRS
jgi:hypothetical protein